MAPHDGDWKIKFRDVRELYLYEVLGPGREDIHEWPVVGVVFAFAKKNYAVGL